MIKEKSPKIRYSILFIFIFLLIAFGYFYLMALNEQPSYDSGPNLLINFVMIIVLVSVGSFIKVKNNDTHSHKNKDQN